LGILGADAHPSVLARGRFVTIHEQHVPERVPVGVQVEDVDDD
jgi:hypothetical protein